MNILVVSMEPPIPANTGARIYLYQRLKILSKHNKVILFSLHESDEVEKYKGEYNEICNEFFYFSRGNKLRNYFKNFLYPYSIGSRVNKSLKKKIESYIKNNIIDVIYLTSIHMIGNLPLDAIKKNKIKVILAQDNIEFLLFKNIAQKESNLIKKIIYHFESYRLKKFEYYTYNKNIFSGYTFISESDMDYFKLISCKNLLLLPPYLEDESFFERKIEKNNMIVFTGKMSYQPNIQAVKWFCKDVFPLILKEIPNAKFYIVGKDPTDEILNLKTENIIVTGEVDNVNEYLSKANLVVIPLLSGGGVKLKLFEAVQNFNIIVTTSKGIEGTKFKDNEHVLVANTPIEFAKCCIQVIKYTEDYYYLAKNSQEMVINTYLKSNIEYKLKKFMMNLGD